MCPHVHQLAVPVWHWCGLVLRVPRQYTSTQTGLPGQAKMADGVDLRRPPDSRTVTVLVGHSRSAQVTRGEPPRVQCAVQITLTVSQ